MSDVEVTYKEPVTRAQTARTLSALAEALADTGKVELTLGNTSMTVRVPDEVQCKVEVEIDEDEVEFEVELRWSTAKRRHADLAEAPAEANGDGGGTEPTAESAESVDSADSADSAGAEATGHDGAEETSAPAKRPAHRRKAGTR
ncbi:amphi-Trp domain-containing protein [Pseudonocardia sp. NPDC049154]|uniref:amphi-Trp domain-containing protein n=1 Tax=Pseudonocardia sp. NPDC049154 TaxID=3155501 RepID=UPI0033E11DD8